MNVFSLIIVGFLGLLCCSFLYYIYKLAKLYRINSSTHESLLVTWYRAFSHLTVVPLIYFHIKDHIFLEFLICILIYLVFKFKSKIISINKIGIVIFVLLISLNIFLVRNFYVYNHYTKPVLNFVKNNRTIFYELLFKKYGFDVPDNNFFENTKFFDGINLSLKETQSLKKSFIEKTLELEKLHKWWKDKYYDKEWINDIEFNRTFSEFLCKYGKWDKIPINYQKKIIDNIKVEFEKALDKTVILIQNENINSPFEYRLNFYKQAIKILEIKEASYLTGTTKKISLSESEINLNINTMNIYITKDNDLFLKLSNANVKKN